MRMAVATKPNETALTESSNRDFHGSSRRRFIGAPIGGHGWFGLVFKRSSSLIALLKTKKSLLLASVFFVFEVHYGETEREREMRRKNMKKEKRGSKWG